jgi:hypothetical protein
MPKIDRSRYGLTLPASASTLEANGKKHSSQSAATNAKPNFVMGRPCCDEPSSIILKPARDKEVDRKIIDKYGYSPNRFWSSALETPARPR